MTYSEENKIKDLEAEIKIFLKRVPYVIFNKVKYEGLRETLVYATELLLQVKEVMQEVITSPEKKYKVKNIDRPDWKEYQFMVIRDCRDEKAPNDGFWYWGSYDELVTAYIEAQELSNGLLVCTNEVEEIK